MDENKRHIAEGWHDKAVNHLRMAREHLKTADFSDSVQAAQVCIELAVKAILNFLEIDFARVHGWDHDKLTKIANQLRKRDLVRKLERVHVRINLPRLLHLVNFWDQFYLQAKYGMEAGFLASPQELVQREEAEIALKHAEECEQAVSWVRQLRHTDTESLLKE